MRDAHPAFPRTVLWLTAVLAAAVLGACSSDDDPAGGAHNDADVQFATEMIPHHAQALDMVEMAEGRGASAEFEQLLGDIEAAQGPEIEQMAGWLEEWGEEVPPTDSAMPMGHGDGHDMGDMGDMGDVEAMPGMMSQDDLDRLDQARAGAFEQMWLTMMIEHHEGAIDMSRTEVDDGQSPDAVALAEDIVESQTAEIDLMQDLLRG